MRDINIMSKGGAYISNPAPDTEPPPHRSTKYLKMQRWDQGSHDRDVCPVQNVEQEVGLPHKQPL